MNSQIALNQAIAAAKDQNWQLAIDLNNQLFEQNPTDLGALNRLGIAYAQLGDLKAAKKAFEAVLDIDKANLIAKKNLLRLKTQPEQLAPSFTNQDFIEEPGKTKTVELHRLAGKQVLDTLTIGVECELKPKNRYISVEAAKAYVGALPDDISFRLARLLETGNTYFCCIRSVSSNHCSVYIKELNRSTENAEINSFPVSKSYFGAAINELEDLLPAGFEEEPQLGGSADTEGEETEGEKRFEDNTRDDREES